MSRTAAFAILTGAVLLAAVSLFIPNAITEFKTFLELSSLLNPCDGAGSPPPCHNK